MIANLLKVQLWIVSRSDGGIGRNRPEVEPDSRIPPGDGIEAR